MTTPKKGETIHVEAFAGCLEVTSSGVLDPYNSRFHYPVACPNTKSEGRERWACYYGPCEDPTRGPFPHSHSGAAYSSGTQRSYYAPAPERPSPERRDGVGKYCPYCHEPADAIQYAYSHPDQISFIHVEDDHETSRCNWRFR